MNHKSTLACATLQFAAANPTLPLLNDPLDISADFRDFSDTYFLADRLSEFDPVTGHGKITYQRSGFVTRQAFDNMLAVLRPVAPNEFPENEYAGNPSLPFSLEFVSSRTLRIRMASGPQVHSPQPELMMAGTVPHDDSWKYEKVAGGHRYASAAGSVTIMEDPFHIEIRDAGGKLLTRTDHDVDNGTSFTSIMPFAFVRRAADYSRSYNTAFTLSPGEKIFGCGESFTGLDKRGQKVVLWTDDVGGFTANSVENMDKDLFARWLAFGMMSSHSRCEGIAPKEPWNYGTSFMDKFRKIDELKYRLMPYVYAQAKDSSEHGLPMVRALFIEYPQDPGSWLLDDEYLYGSCMLVAPLMHENETGRNVYLPPGTWIDYQTGKSYAGGWQKIAAGEIPEIILVRDGMLIPHIALAQSTLQMDWSKLGLTVYAKDSTTAKGTVYLPGDNELHELTLTNQNGTFKLASDPSVGKVRWDIRAAENK